MAGVSFDAPRAGDERGLIGDGRPGYSDPGISVILEAWN